MKTAEETAPNPEVAAQLVQRVAGRLAKGLPLELALAGESLTPDAYEALLGRHPELADIQALARRKFIEESIDTLVREEKARANLQWLLERRHPDLFARGREAGVASEPQETQTIAGMSNKELEIAREYARNLR